MYSSGWFLHICLVGVYTLHHIGTYNIFLKDISTYLPNSHLEIWVVKAKYVLKTLTKKNMNSSFVELKCFQAKTNKTRNAIISMKQRCIMTALIFRTNAMIILKLSLVGPIKNLQVNAAVLKMTEMTIALHIWANSLFFIDLFKSDTFESKVQLVLLLSSHLPPLT